jgi:uncharacterized protein (TIGR03083 family)
MANEARRPATDRRRPVQPPAVEEAIGAVAETVPRLTAMLRTAGDGSRRIPHLDWTVGETAAHLWQLMAVYTKLPGGGSHHWPDVEHSADANAELLATGEERDPAVLAELIDRDTPALLDAYRSHGHQPVSYVAGAPTSASSVLAILAGEFLLHGWDIARGLGTRWKIPQAHAVVAFRGFCAVLPMFVAPETRDFRGSIVLTLRGGLTVTMIFTDGSLTLSEGACRRPDCRISADPGVFALSSFGRIGQWTPVLKGQIMAYGRKPWLAARLPSLLRSP